jgi:hypothetical protein
MEKMLEEWLKRVLARAANRVFWRTSEKGFNTILSTIEHEDWSK